MKIEVGKKYITQGGYIVKITEEFEDIFYKFRGYTLTSEGNILRENIVFTKEGYFYPDCPENNYNLIGEYKEKKFKITDTGRYRTRSGDVYVVTEIDDEESYYKVGGFLEQDPKTRERWSEYGRCLGLTVTEKPRNLIEKLEDVKEEEKPEIKLEAGKTYLTKGGHKVKIYPWYALNFSDYVFRGEIIDKEPIPATMAPTYTIEGLFIKEQPDHELTIAQEISPDPANFFQHTREEVYFKGEELENLPKVEYTMKKSGGIRIDHRTGCIQPYTEEENNTSKFEDSPAKKSGGFRSGPYIGVVDIKEECCEEKQEEAETNISFRNNKGKPAFSQIDPHFISEFVRYICKNAEEYPNIDGKPRWQAIRPACLKKDVLDSGMRHMLDLYEILKTGKIEIENVEKFKEACFALTACAMFGVHYAEKFTEDSK
jgi:hypothetical protein